MTEQLYINTDVLGDETYIGTWAEWLNCIVLAIVELFYYLCYYYRKESSARFALKDRENRL